MTERARVTNPIPPLTVYVGDKAYAVLLEALRGTRRTNRHEQHVDVEIEGRMVRFERVLSADIVPSRPSRGAQP